MPINRPRRIFRAGPLPRRYAALPWGRVSLALVIVGGAGIGARQLWRALPMRTPVEPASVLAPTVIAAEAAQIAVVDGDTLRVRDTVVRLMGVAAPERGKACHGPGGGFDCGAAATRALADMVKARPVACRLHGLDEMGHAFGLCEASGTLLNRALVAGGWARADLRQIAAAGRTISEPELADAERAARSARLGLWPADGLDGS